MSWNIFKKIAQLEQQVKDLTDFNSDNSRWICRLQDKVRHIENKLFTQAVESKAFSIPADQARENKRQYQREWYAKKRAKLNQEKNSEAAREKRNAYARAYYARKKGERK
jgi:hypothetical protein